MCLVTHLQVLLLWCIDEVDPLGSARRPHARAPEDSRRSSRPEELVDPDGAVSQLPHHRRMCCRWLPVNEGCARRQQDECLEELYRSFRGLAVVRTSLGRLGCRVCSSESGRRGLELVRLLCVGRNIRLEPKRTSNFQRLEFVDGEVSGW